MSTTKSLLVELLVEELPPKSLKKLGESFGATIFSELQKADGLDDGAAITTFASPRRLAAHITNVFPVAAAKPVKTRLMPVSVALDAQGMPTAALMKKLESLGLEYLLKANESVWDERISREGEGKNESMFHTDVAAGMYLHESLQIALKQALEKLPINKGMTYQLADGWSSVNFVRPAHGLVALHGADIIPVQALGLAASNTTEGHRFMSSGIIRIKEADSYAEQLLNEGKVIASFADRRASIEKQLESLRVSKESNEVIRPDALLDEVTALVEWPKVYECHFDHEFLSVPPECLILTMQTNQKYFPCTLSGALRNRFLVVSNIETNEPSSIVGGNERVVRPRLADAKFFFEQDLKKSLASRVNGLSKVVYHNKLGSQGERVERVRVIAKAIGEQLGGYTLAAQADQAAMLSKADLLTDMVGEFPELQGVMGWYYARHEKQPDDIALAIMDHYKPRFAGDELPRNAVGICVALADKLETLVGMFGIGELPTGDKDPFALRRHALGVIRMLIEKNLGLELDWLLKIGSGAFYNIDDELLLNMSDLAFDGNAVETRRQLTAFIYDRLAGSLREQGYNAQEVEAVLCLRPKQLSDVSKRLAAVRAFAALPEASALAAANKRVGNILKKADGEFTLRQAQGERIEINLALLKESAEQALHQAISQITPKADKAFAAGDYTASLSALAALREPVDAFFDKVMVNVENMEVRANRLALLVQLHQAMNRVADISKLAT